MSWIQTDLDALGTIVAAQAAQITDLEAQLATAQAGAPDAADLAARATAEALIAANTPK